MQGAKKHLGQHFLHDLNAARRIADAVPDPGENGTVLEIGPGRGVLTAFLHQRFPGRLRAIELDADMLPILDERFPSLRGKIALGDALAADWLAYPQPISLAGNFPYNISTQLLLKMAEGRAAIPSCVGMFQREVGERVAAPHGSKTYGITSAWLQLFYDIEVILRLGPGAFSPPPKVDSVVIRLTRHHRHPDVPDGVFRVIKAAFGQRRKTLRNSLSAYQAQFSPAMSDVLTKRAEQLSPAQLLALAKTLLRGSDYQ